MEHNAVIGMKEETKSNKEKKIIQRSNFLQIANKSLLTMLGETDISWTQFHKFHVSSVGVWFFHAKWSPAHESFTKQVTRDM